MLDRGISEFARPSEGIEFEDICQHIVREFRLRREKSQKSRREGARGWLLEVAYDLLTVMLDDDHADLIDARIEKYERYPLGIPANINAFQLGLMAIFAHANALDRSSRQAIKSDLSHQDREWIAKRLWHAYRHYVPAVFVRGFLGQIDSKALNYHATNNQLEAGFESWIIKSRLVDESSHDRGIYPQSIESESSAIRQSDDSDDDWGVNGDDVSDDDWDDDGDGDDQ